MRLDKFINFTKKRLDHAMSKTLFICMEEDAFSKCNGDFCENLKTLVKICCVDNNNKCETSIGDNYITVNYNNHSYIYKIEKIYTQKKTGKIKVLRNATRTTLTLITCTKDDEYHQTIYIAYLDRIA